ncbi:kinase-like domain-containing protein [Powellomyces hirtus]|nr:kinase-like domain-containing protein [Powellomyces hirtus]
MRKLMANIVSAPPTVEKISASTSGGLIGATSTKLPKAAEHSAQLMKRTRKDRLSSSSAESADPSCSGESSPSSISTSTAGSVNGSPTNERSIRQPQAKGRLTGRLGPPARVMALPKTAEEQEESDHSDMSIDSQEDDLTTTPPASELDEPLLCSIGPSHDADKSMPLESTVVISTSNISRKTSTVSAEPPVTTFNARPLSISHVTQTPSHHLSYKRISEDSSQRSWNGATPSLTIRPSLRRAASTQDQPVSAIGALNWNPTGPTTLNSVPMHLTTPLPGSAYSQQNVHNATPTIVPGNAGHWPMPTHFHNPVKDKTNISVNGVVYKKLGLIGRGGSSKVYKIMSPQQKLFALKKVKLKGQEDNAVEGYLNEIALLKRLKKNERIIQLIDSELNESEGYLLMVLEYGEIDLAHILQKEQQSRLSLNFIRMYWEQMLRAVHAIHEENIIHSDLKPANFLLVEGALKLIDFGIAKSIPNDTTNIQRDHQTGTINYMAPEAIAFVDQSASGSNRQYLKLGRSSDVWSLGCILYQLVYDRPPFAHLPVMKKLQCIVDPSYRIQFEECEDASLLESLKRCLGRDPRERLTIPQLLSGRFLNPGAGHFEGREETEQIRNSIHGIISCVE